MRLALNIGYVATTGDDEQVRLARHAEDLGALLRTRRPSSSGRAVMTTVAEALEQAGQA